MRLNPCTNSAIPGTRAYSPTAITAKLDIASIPRCRCGLFIYSIQHRAYWLADKRGAFVGSGLQDATGGVGGFLGYMLDVSLGWDPQWSYMKRMSFDFGYSHLFKGDYFDKVPFSLGMKDTNYGYTMVTFKF